MILVLIASFIPRTLRTEVVLPGPKKWAFLPVVCHQKNHSKTVSN